MIHCPLSVLPLEPGLQELRGTKKELHNIIYFIYYSECGAKYSY